MGGPMILNAELKARVREEADATVRRVAASGWCVFPTPEHGLRFGVKCARRVRAAATGARATRSARTAARNPPPSRTAQLPVHHSQRGLIMRRRIGALLSSVVLALSGAVAPS